MIFIFEEGLKIIYHWQSTIVRPIVRRLMADTVTWSSCYASQIFAARLLR